jgi:hypothetical protein
MTQLPQHGCDHAIRNEKNQNIFDCMYMGDCIQKQIVDARPTYYSVHCITTSASSDVLEELLKFIDENAVSYDYGYYKPSVDAGSLLRKIAELRGQQTKCEEVHQNLEQVKAKPSKERKS